MNHDPKLDRCRAPGIFEPILETRLARRIPSPDGTQRVVLL